MSFGELNYKELREAAYAEAADFAIDSAELAERDTIEAYTIEDSKTKERGLAVSVVEEEDGHIFRVSIADPGTYILPDSALKAFALRNLWTSCKSEGKIMPMFPPEIGEDKLSFVEGKPRSAYTLCIPIDNYGKVGSASFAQHTVIAKNLTPSELEERVLERDSSDNYFSRLDESSKWLFSLRQTDPDMPFLLQTIEGDEFFNDEDGAAGRFIRQEAIFALNTIAALFAKREQIPYVFRNQGNVFSEDNIDPMLAPATYSSVAQGHRKLRLGANAYLHFPLSRFGDYVNQANLIAFLDGREIPFNTIDIDYIVSRMNRAETKERSLGRSALWVADSDEQDYRHIRSPKSRPKVYDALTLTKKLQSTTANEADVAQVLFGSITGSAEETAAAKDAAIDFIMTNINFGRAVINVGIAKRWLEQTELPDGSFTITDKNGNIFPYALAGKANSDMLTLVKLVAQIAGREVNPVVPDHMTREGRIHKNPFRYIDELDYGRGLFLGVTYSTNKATNESEIAVQFTLKGVRYTRRAVAATEEEARKSVGHAILEEFDLVDNPPPRLPKGAKRYVGRLEAEIPEAERRAIKRAAYGDPITQEPKMLPAQDPVSILSIHAQRSGVALPHYEDITTVNEENLYTVKLTFTNASGKPQVITARALHDKHARGMAADIALAQLPPLPMKKKKK